MTREPSQLIQNMDVVNTMQQELKDPHAKVLGPFDRGASMFPSPPRQGQDHRFNKYIF